MLLAMAASGQQVLAGLDPRPAGSYIQGSLSLHTELLYGPAPLSNLETAAVSS